MELLDGLLVVAKILLASDEDDGKALAEMQDLRDPLRHRSRLAGNILTTRTSAREQLKRAVYLLLDVVKRVRGVYGEADQNDVGVGIRQRSEAIVVFLAGSIPQSEFDMFAVDFDVGDVVLENGGDVHLMRAHDVSTLDCCLHKSDIACP